MPVTRKSPGASLRRGEMASKAARELTPLAPFIEPESNFDPVCLDISEKQFRSFQELIYSEAGIWLSPAKTSLLTGRLAKRLRYHGLQSFEDYYSLVVESPEECVQM